MDDKPKFDLFKNITSKYYDLDVENLPYNEICEDVARLSGASYVVINILTPDRKHTETIAISGLSKNIKRASEIFGFNLLGKKWEVDDFALTAMNTKSLINQGAIDKSAPHIKKSVASILKTAFGIGDIYSVGLFSHNQVIGTLVLVMPRKKKLEGNDCIELFAQQISDLIYRAESKKIIREATEKTRIVTEHSPDTVIIVDQDLKITYVNRLSSNYSNRKVIGNSVLNYVPEKHKAEYKAFLTEALLTGNIKTGEVLSWDENNTRQVFLVNFIPIKSENKISSIYIISHDITEQEEKNEIIQNQNHYLKETTRIAKIGIWEYDIKAKEFKISEEALTLIGFIDGENISLAQTLSIYKTEDKQLMQQAIEKAITNGKGYDLEFLATTPDNKKKWIRSIANVKTENGIPLKIIGILQETTEYHNNLLEQQRTANQLAQFQNALNSSSIISKTDKNGVITFVNNNFLKISQFQAKELLGYTHAKINSSYHNKEFWEDLWTTIKSGKIWRGEIKNKAKDGTPYWVDTTVIPLYSNNNEFTEFLSIRNDITNRKKTEIELALIKEQLDDIINNVDSAMWSMDMNGNYLFMNRATEKLTGYSSTEFYSDKEFWRILFSHEHQLRIDSSKYELLKNGETEREQLITTKSGEQKWVVTKRKLFRDKLGNPTRIDAISTDITKRKKDEEEIRLAKQKLDSVFNEMDDVIWSISLPDYKMIFSTPSVEKVFGITHEEFMKDNKYWERTIYMEDRLVIDKIYSDLENYGHYEEEYRIITKQGSIKWISNKGKIINNEKGKPQRIDGHISDISDHKFAEQILRDSEKSLKEAEHIAKIGRWELDLIHNKLYWSDSIFEIWEKENKKENASYENFLDSIHPEDRDKVNKAYIDSLKYKRPYTIEHRLLMPDGRVKWIKETCRTDYDHKGIALRSVGIAQDLTDRKISELELIKLKENLELTSKVAGIGGWELDCRTNKIIWTQITKDIYDVDSDFQPDLNTIVQFCSEQHRDVLQEAIQNSILNQIGYKLELEIITAKGQHVWIETKGEPDVINNQTTRIYGTVRDISLRKQTDLIISKQTQFQKLLTEISTKLVKSNIHTIDNTILKALELFGKYMSSDRAFVFQLDSNSQTVSNTHNWELHDTGLVPRVQNVEFKNYKWLLKQIQKQTVYAIEDVNTLPEIADFEKSRFEILGIKSMLFVRLDINGVPYGIFGIASKQKPQTYTKETIIETQVVSNIISDALIKNQLELKSEKAKEEAELANKSKTEFLANMSHEIRTPMNAILGFSELLKGNTISPKYENYVNGILLGGKSLLSLINDILDLSKIEAGKMEVNKEEVNLEQLINEVHSIFRQSAKDKALFFNYLIEPNVPPIVLVDEVRMRQILFNIIGNSIKFTQKGGVSVRILTEPEADNKIKLKFQISDTGIGIPEDQHQAIFEPFKQMDGQSTRKFGGTGLGLAITKRLVNIMNGHIDLKSEVNQGTIVTVTINSVESIPSSKQLNQKAEALVKCDFNNQTILLVEDINSNREVIKGMLEGCKLTILEAKNGQEAIQTIQHTRPDLILMDIMMPVMDGNEAILLIKNNPITENIPLVALTASSVNCNEPNNIHLCEDFIRKPINKAKLVTVLRYFLVHNNPSINSEVLPVYTENKLLWKLALSKNTKYELMSKWDTVSELMSVDDIENYALELTRIARENNDETLMNYCNELLDYARDFDFENMKKTFERFIY